MNLVDKILNSYTMYRVVLYGLLLLAAYSFVLSIFGLLSFKPLELIASLTLLSIVCFFSNIAFGRIFKVAVNVESSLITALILFFLLWPSLDPQSLTLIAVAGVIAMASKFVIAYKRKHLFNPAAFAAVALFLFGSGAIWWTGTLLLLPATVVVGLLIVRKVRKFTLFLTFLATTFLSFLLQTSLQSLNPFEQSLQFFTSFPVIFFGTIMLTEPLTMPPTRRLQMIYAAICGILFSYQGSLGPIILTTELALLIGNFFSFIVSPKYRFKLIVSDVKALAHETFEFSFVKPKMFNFKPGQYLEWTIPTTKTDRRGNRRYFTIASSPTEEFIKLGVKFNASGSSFKSFLKSLKPKDSITAGQLVGDFTLPNDKTKKLVFIAGGIGVTPFRSIIKYLVDRNEKRDIVFFYSNKKEDEIAYKDVFTEAENKLGIKVVYILSDENVPPTWKGERGRINEEMLKKYVSDANSRLYYLSGPNAMVENYKKMLKSLKVKPTSIVTDYFPGF